MLGNDLLEGELVRLTAITREDLSLFTEWFANIEFRRFLALIAMPFTLEDEEGWYEAQRKDPDTINFAIRTLDENQLIGSCGIFAIHWPARNCIVGIAVADDAA
jgi:ribosomal-protein-alanine N-acetyltransferase